LKLAAGEEIILEMASDFGKNKPIETPALPAFCPNCGSVFPFHGIRVGKGASAKIRIGSDVATKCPVCTFSRAKVSEGIYQANSTAIEVLSAPESNRGIIEEFRKLVERAAAGEISQKEALERARVISPKYASLIEKHASLGVNGLLILLSLITAVLQYEGNKSSSDASEKILKAITEQTLVLKNHHYVDQKSAVPTKRKTNQQFSLHKHHSKHRAEVNKQRRAALKRRREDFGRSRTH
jgi:hypothetical protein